MPVLADNLADWGHLGGGAGKKPSSAPASSSGTMARLTTLMPRPFAGAMTVWRVIP